MTFSHLPSFASYLLTHQLHEFSLEVLSLTRKLNPLLLKRFEITTYDNLKKIYLEKCKEFLQYVSKNRTSDYIETIVKKYAADELTAVKNDS
ncbi:MAG TPA: hypothetical protein VNA26_00475, partial [Chitinophagaceae bacterium]|nr:hypothetical protein [Chitinophagaceae bacterium]